MPSWKGKQLLLITYIPCRPVKPSNSYAPYSVVTTQKTSQSFHFLFGHDYPQGPVVHTDNKTWTFNHFTPISFSLLLEDENKNAIKSSQILIMKTLIPRTWAYGGQHPFLEVEDYFGDTGLLVVYKEQSIYVLVLSWSRLDFWIVWWSPDIP